MMKAVLFDFDGVLTLDETGSKSICNYVSKAAGVERGVLKNAYRKYNADLLTGKLTHPDVWQSICDEVGQQIGIGVLYDSFVHTPINAEMVRLVRSVKDKNYKIGMVTDNKADRIKSIMAYHHWEALFDGVAVSAEVGSGKSGEAIFHRIFHLLAVRPEECVFIDNKSENLVVPQKMGVSVIFFDYSKKDIDGLRRKLHASGIEASNI